MGQPLARAHRYATRTSATHNPALTTTRQITRNAHSSSKTRTLPLLPPAPCRLSRAQHRSRASSSSSTSTALPLPPAAPYSRLSTRPWRKRCRGRGMGRGREVERPLKAEAPPEARTTEAGILLQRGFQREGSPMGSPTECCGNSLLGLDAPGAKKTLSMRGSGAASKILAAALGRARIPGLFHHGQTGRKVLSFGMFTSC